MYMYVNKRVELAQRGIALEKIYVLLLLLCRCTHKHILILFEGCRMAGLKADIFIMLYI